MPTSFTPSCCFKVTTALHHLLGRGIVPDDSALRKGIRGGGNNEIDGTHLRHPRSASHKGREAISWVGFYH